MKSELFWALLLVFLAPSSMFGLDSQNAQDIVERSDNIRNPKGSFKLDTRLIEYDSGNERNELKLVVYAKKDKISGQYKNLVRYVEPPRDAGKMVLLNGTNMWFYDSTSKASVRISSQQRLIGQASEADVVTVNLANDYEAKMAGIERLDDADLKSRECWRLDLSPSRDEAMYGRIDYWVEKGSYQPVKGKFYSDSGRLLKIAYYHKYQEQLGTFRPTETIIIDAVNSKLVTVMTFFNYEHKNIPETWFQREYLPRIMME